MRTICYMESVDVLRSCHQAELKCEGGGGGVGVPLVVTQRPTALAPTADSGDVDLFYSPAEQHRERRFLVSAEDTVIIKHVTRANSFWVQPVETRGCYH